MKETSNVKKPTIVFTIADDNNLPLAKNLERSFKKFHPNIPFVIHSGDKLKASLAEDKNFFYRATPILAENYIKEYDLVLKIDADSIITGSLDYIFKTDDYDLGTVMNWNRVDPKIFGVVQGWGISPVEYMNCGFVAMRSEKFVHEWKLLCFTPQYDRMQFREQDLMNAMIYFGNWNIRCFDHGDGPANYHAWHGLIAKGEWLKAKMVGDNIIIPKGEDNFPKRDLELKVIHFAGGNTPSKGNYKTLFSEEVIERLNYLVK